MSVRKSPITMALRQVGHVFKYSYHPWPALFWGTSVFALNVSGYFLFNSEYFNGGAKKEVTH